MSPDEIHFEILNAYVDGKLDPKRHAEVAAAAARDPEVAERIAALARLKAGVAGPAPPASGGDGPTAQRTTRLRWPVALAASIAAVAVAAGIALLDPFRAHDGTVDIAWVTTAHQSWADQPKAADETPGRTLRVALGTWLGPGTYVPDLSSARLSIAEMRRITGPEGRDAALIAYRGTRGCKVSLMIFRDPGWSSERLVPFERGKIRGFHWRAGELSYVMTAEGMARARFDLIAASVHRASLKHVPIEPEARTALTRSRANSPPCAA